MKIVVFLFFMIWTICFASLQCQIPQAGSLIMVRCDKDEEFLPSPGDIQLSELQASFNPSLDTLVFVHGYLNDFEKSKKSYEEAMPVFKAILGNRNYVGFHWPSQVLWFGTAVSNANKAGTYLLHVLASLTKWYGSQNRRIHLVSHSLGGRVVLVSLQNNAARYVKWGYCMQMASAVHNNVYITPFTGTNEIPLRSYIYYSGRDAVLKYLYALYYWLFGREMPHKTPEMIQWSQLPAPEQLEYLRRLDIAIQQGHIPQTKLDISLAEALERAQNEAMGLVGSIPVIKVENVNVTDIAPDHFYWDNSNVIRKVAEKLTGN